MHFINLNFIKNKKFFYLIIIFLFSVLINQHYGLIGLNPIDSFATFNAGYDILNGHYPFKDYWTITGPLTAFIQALFFKIFGVSWFSYVFHASILNSILSISVFLTLYKFKLNINFCFFYSILVSILAHPSTGTPYVDHQSSYYSVISIFCFILAIKTSEKFYWYFLPIIIGVSFLTKQAPTGYVFLVIFFLLLYYFIFNFNLKRFVLPVYGSITFIVIFFIALFYLEISFISFLEQYILFPLSLGESRFEYLEPITFKRFFLRFKLIHLGTLILFLALIKNLINDINYYKKIDFIIILTLITSSYGFIIHQLMTINGLFIFFIIPILFGFSHVYFLKYFKKNNFIFYTIIFLTIGSTINYSYKYINKRDFWDLRNVDLSDSLNAKVLDKKMNGLKWKTVLYPNSSKDEINNLTNAIEIIKKDKKIKSIITDYQFISVVLSTYDFSPSQVWFEYHVNPSRESKFHKSYKNFFEKVLISNNVKIIYLVKPMWGGEKTVENVLDQDCYIKQDITKILSSYLLTECDDLKG
jgi:hypothetical protein